MAAAAVLGGGYPPSYREGLEVVKPPSMKSGGYSREQEGRNIKIYSKKE